MRIQATRTQSDRQVHKNDIAKTWTRDTREQRERKQGAHLEGGVVVDLVHGSEGDVSVARVRAVEADLGSEREVAGVLQVSAEGGFVQEVTGGQRHDRAFRVVGDAKISLGVHEGVVELARDDTADHAAAAGLGQERHRGCTKKRDHMQDKKQQQQQ